MEKLNNELNQSFEIPNIKLYPNLPNETRFKKFRKRSCENAIFGGKRTKKEKESFYLKKEHVFKGFKFADRMVNEKRKNNKFKEIK